MKLLEDNPTAEIRERHSSTGGRVALASGVLVLVIGAIIGALLVTSGGSDEADQSAVGDSADQVELATWADGVSQACAKAVAGNGVLAAGSEARHSGENIADVDSAVRDLARAVRAQPLPTKIDDQERATSAVMLGDEADQAWAGLPPDADDAAIDRAADSTDAFIASLLEAGADCAALS